MIIPKQLTVKLQYEVWIHIDNIVLELLEELARCYGIKSAPHYSNEKMKIIKPFKININEDKLTHFMLWFGQLNRTDKTYAFHCPDNQLIVNIVEATL